MAKKKKDLKRQLNTYYLAIGFKNEHNEFMIRGRYVIRSRKTQETLSKELPHRKVWQRITKNLNVPTATMHLAVVRMMPYSKRIQRLPDNAFDNAIQANSSQ